MAKHPKQRSNGTAAPASSRPVPYSKKGKARVEVKFEGTTTPSKPPKPKAAQPQSQPVPSAKAKGKAKAASPDLVAPSVPANAAASSFVVIAGSYEKLLYGLEGSYAPGSSTPTLKPIFIFPAHLACVKAVAASPGGKWLATGSEDEFVKVWDLRRRKEVGSLSQHTGSITSVHFPSSSHLITTSEDSTLSLFRTSDWALLKSLKGHSGRVNHVDVHPTGRVALTVGKDKTLKMWDLMRGRGAASLPLGSEAEMVKFSPLGTHFAVLYPKKVEIYSLTLKLLHTLETKSRYNTLLFSLIPTDDDEDEDNEDSEDIEVLCVGTEKGLVEVYTVEIGTASESDEEAEGPDGSEEGAKEPKPSADLDLVGTLVGHTNRVKSISALPFLIPGSGSTPAKRNVLLSSVSSDGLINLHDVTALLASAGESGSSEAEPIASYDTKGSRLTVCFLADGKKGSTAMPDMNGNGIGKKEEDGEETDEEDEDVEDIYGSSGEGDDAEEDQDGMEVEIESGEEEEEEEGEEE